MWHIAAAVAIAVSGAAGAAQEPDRNSRAFDQPDRILPGLRTILEPRDSMPSTCLREPDVVHGRKYGAALVMDVYTPKGKRNGAGVVFVVSGGLWSGPEYVCLPFFTQPIGNLAEKGYVVFAVMHGSQPKYTLLEIKDDLPRAVRYVRAHATRFGVRPDRLGIMGYSSGGHLALLAAVTGTPGDPKAEDPVDRESSKLQAVVAYYPNTDLLNYGPANRLISEHFAALKLGVDACYDFHRWDKEKALFVPLSEAEKRVVLRATSPLMYVTADGPPTLLFHGDQDTVVPIQQSHVFARRMGEVGAQCKLVVAKGAGHGWKTPLPGETEEVAQCFERHLFGATR
jgi:acetyl esterase/lipase